MRLLAAALTAAAALTGPLVTQEPPAVTGLALSSPDRPCGTLDDHPAAGNQTWFTASASDPGARTFFYIWPVGRRAEEGVRFGGDTGAPVRSWFDLSRFPDGTVLAWTARAFDGDWGPEPAPCHLVVANIPLEAPTIEAHDYREAEPPGSGGPGVPGEFTLDAGGNPNVVRFEYRRPLDALEDFVAPDRPGGRARISFPPPVAGANELTARSLDAVGNASPWRTYRFHVRDTAPTAAVEVAGVGLPSRITFGSSTAELTSFVYTVDGGPAVTIAATGGRASAEVVFTGTGSKPIVVRGYAGDELMGITTEYAWVTDQPTIVSPAVETLVGVAGDYTFRPRTAGVVAYLYDFGDGEQRADADAAGTATVSWAPQQDGHHGLTVKSVTADGGVSGPASAFFTAIDAKAWVTASAGTVGRPIQVWMSTHATDATGFAYSFDGGPEQRAEGSFTSVEVVPARAGDLTFTARTTMPGGAISAPTTITIRVTP